MSFAEELWQANQDLARASLDHPFVRGIADGSLPRERFAYYVGQDAFYLEAFARAYTIAAAKAPDWEGFGTLYRLVDAVLHELHLHEKYAASWGVDLRNVKPQPVTRRYTDFLLSTAWAYDSGLTMAAMGPCMRLYVYLGKELARNGIAEHGYSDWIRTYSDPALDELVAQLEALINRYTKPDALAHSTYRYAMLCERDFFQAAWEARLEW